MNRVLVWLCGSGAGAVGGGSAGAGPSAKGHSRATKNARTGKQTVTRSGRAKRGAAPAAESGQEQGAHEQPAAPQVLVAMAGNARLEAVEIPAGVMVDRLGLSDVAWGMALLDAQVCPG